MKDSEANNPFYNGVFEECAKEIGLVCSSMSTTKFPSGRYHY
jgi:hypothetical protein